MWTASPSNGPIVRLAVHFGIIIGKNGPLPPHFWGVFLGTLIFGEILGVGSKTVFSFQYPRHPFGISSFQ
jgi:hypothetical protein